MQAWDRNALDKLAIFSIFGPILLKNAKNGQLARTALITVGEAAGMTGCHFG
jgi:hypothetical protein